ncbi:hypothetical protein RCO48_36835 [Peribacillus frigoritolerans]|nr:hypothetical protein [Peribacillus frigoritolerans]
MRFIQFLKYEKPYIVFIRFYLLHGFSRVLHGPQYDMELEHFSICGGINPFRIDYFSFLYRYQQSLRAIRARGDEDHENLSLEAASLQHLFEEKEREHIRSLNQIHEKQNEYYDFIVSWFHEIKTPISVLRLMQQTEIDAKIFHDEVSRIEHYVDQALYYAKLDNFNQDYDIKNCDLEKIGERGYKNSFKKHLFPRKSVFGYRLNQPPSKVTPSGCNSS